MRHCRHTIAALILLGVTGCEIISPVTQEEAIRLMEDRKSADARREGIADLSSRFDEGRVPPYTARYREFAKTDPDYIVRAMAIRASNICRDHAAIPIFVAALDDDHPAVRLEGAKALANVPDPSAVPGLLRLAMGVRVSTLDGHEVRTPEDRDVRIAAVDALRRYPGLDVEIAEAGATRRYTTIDLERTLVGFLNENEFATAWQARQSLIALTGTDLQYDEAAWLQYLVRRGT